ncbi:hypothetical protein GCM10028791_34050 [Echinicola sediminis]
MSSNIRIRRVCQYCGIEFTAKTTVTKYCGDSCAKKAYKKRKKEESIAASNEETVQQVKLEVKKLEEKSFLTISQTCELLGISRMSLYRIIKEGTLRATKLGRRTIIHRKNLDSLFNINNHESTFKETENQ